MNENTPSTFSGSPLPLGASFTEKGINFALYSSSATKIELLLFAPGEHHPFFKTPLEHKTGDIWHIFLSPLPQKMEYAYRVDEREELLIDPYAKALNSPLTWGTVTGTDPYAPKGCIRCDPPFDWEGDHSPGIPLEELLIYEMHVRSFTRHPSSKVTHPGTFLGIVEKIPYLKELGINAIELMPIHEFDECENKLHDPLTHKRLYNVWGYSTVNFFTPMNRYGSAEDFKTLVKELHRAQIEVILDVVFNHTAEGNELGPILSFCGIDNATYYLLTAEGKYLNYSGTGNTLNCNHPVVQQLILDSLHYWITEMHVDGFRFDLASVFTRGTNGEPLSDPPLLLAMSKDPILKKVRLISEAWDAAGLYQLGEFPRFGNWAEWNGKYRDAVRRFIKGTDSCAGDFATALCGSQDLYGQYEGPQHSINFITAHDGLTLQDLVSYQRKHNKENGEENRDGINENDSWNCGHEGPTEDQFISILRERQKRNFLVALMASLGIPMILMGDEYGHTRRGNNNAWCQDNELNWFLWDSFDKPFQAFYIKLLHWRKQHPLFQQKKFLTNDDVDWHSNIPFTPDWSPSSRLVAYTLKKAGLYLAFHANFSAVNLQLPPPPSGKKWYRLIDTSRPDHHNFREHSEETNLIHEHYLLSAYAALVLEAF